MRLWRWAQRRDRNAVLVGALLGPPLGLVIALAVEPIPEGRGSTAVTHALPREPIATAVEPQSVPVEAGPAPEAPQSPRQKTVATQVAQPRAEPPEPAVTPAPTAEPSQTPAPAGCDDQQRDESREGGDAAGESGTAQSGGKPEDEHPSDGEGDGDSEVPGPGPPLEPLCGAPPES